MEHQKKKKTVYVRHLKFNGVMNTNENVGRLGRGCRGSTFHHTAEEIWRKVMFHLIIFSLPNERHDVISHVIKGVILARLLK